MKELASLLFATSLELRRGTLTPGNLSESSSLLSSLISGRNERREQTALEIAERKYPSVSFNSTLLTKEIIVDIVLRSRISAQDIQASLRAHPYFSDQDKNAPSWQVLWKSYELPSIDQDAAVLRFEKDFEARAFSDPGGLYHAITLGIWLSELGYPAWEVETVEDKLKQYVTDVYSGRTPTIAEVADHTLIDTRMGAYGLSFRQENDPLLARIAEFEQKTRSDWRKTGYPALAVELETMAFEDSERFMREVCFTNGGPSTYASIGVLRFIDPVAFGTKLAEAPYRSQKAILMSLAIRYEQVSGYVELREEGQWLRALTETIEAEASKLPRIARSSLLNLRSHYLTKSLARFE